MNDAMEASLDKKGQHVQLVNQGTIVVLDVTPLLIYDDTVFTESQGGLHPGRASKHVMAAYPFNPGFASNVIDFTREYTIDLHGDPPSSEPRLVLHAFYFPERKLVHFMVELLGLQRPIERLLGGVVLTFTPELGKVRFLTTRDKDEAQNPRDGDKATLDWDEFLYAWYGGNGSGLSDQFPVDDKLRVSFLMAQIPGGTCAAIPVNDHGQRSLIRCGFQASIDKLQMAFISGTPLPCNDILETDVQEPQWVKYLAGGIIEFGEDPVALAESAFHDCACLLNRPYVLRTAKQYPDMFEYLGFCTWNTFYRDQSLDNIRRLAEHNFTPGAGGTDRFKYIIVDDGWQPTNEMDLRKDLTRPLLPGEPLYLTSLATNYKFPGGMAPVATMLKEQYGFKWFGVWHTINGYWSGILPESLLARTYRCIKVGINNTIDPFTTTGFRFWLDYYASLRQAGVELVKIDNSSSIANLFEGTYPFDHAVAQVIATEHGAAASMGITILNCLGSAHDAKFYWGHANAARVTNDFAPQDFKNTKRQFHQYLTQSLQMAPFCWPDADMFFTSGAATECIVHLHMISGGPVYIADDVGKTDLATINKISFPDGRLPRLARPGLPMTDVVFQDIETEAASTMWNYHDIPGWGRVFYVVAANMILDDKPCTARFTMQDLGTLAFDCSPELLAFSYVVKEASEPSIQIITRDAGEILADLENFESRYYCISPLVNGIALLGIEGMLNGTRGISRVQPIDEKSVLVSPGYPSMLDVYVEPGKMLEAFECNGNPLLISRDDSSSSIAKITITDRPFLFVIG
ncbi:MAG TPA: Sip1-related alpha-galactosidase [Candidatus Lokiarchaeia archaeon]|nr:Sip1-related alpha-galactosidase [Candidatus Lokiarchaeia archaeon]